MALAVQRLSAVDRREIINHLVTESQFVAFRAGHSQFHNTGINCRSTKVGDPMVTSTPNPTNSAACGKVYLNVKSIAFMTPHCNHNSFVMIANNAFRRELHRRVVSGRLIGSLSGFWT